MAAGGAASCRTPAEGEFESAQGNSLFHAREAFSMLFNVDSFPLQAI